MDADMQCSICLAVYLDPVTVVPCGHSFCAPCIERWLDRGGHSVSCPLCSTPMAHVALSYALKAIVERRHGAALLERRTALGRSTVQSFSRDVRPYVTRHYPLLDGMLGWVQPLQLRIRERPLQAALGMWLGLLCFFFVYFLCGGGGVVALLLGEGEEGAGDVNIPLLSWKKWLEDAGGKSNNAPLDIFARWLAWIPGFVAQVFCYCFVTFFLMFSGWHWLVVRGVLRP